MRRIFEILALITIMVLLLGGGAVPVAAAPEVIVSLDASDEVALGSDFTANVNINEVVGFDACNYDVSFDASVLRLDGVTAGVISSATIPVDIYNEISPGTYRVVQNVPGLAGVSGSGYLAVLHFHVVGTGSSAISLSKGMLSNILAEKIPATWVADSVMVVAAVEVTTPPVAVTTPTVASPSSVAVAPGEEAALPAKTAINWPVLWGVIGVAIAVGITVFLRGRRRVY